MFIVMVYNNTFGVTSTRTGIVELLNSRLASYEREFERRSGRLHGDKMVKEEYLGSMFRNLRVYEVPNTFEVTPHVMDQRSGVTNISSQFFSVDNKDTEIGTKVTAIVTKKDLRTSGSRVQVLGVAGQSINDPSEMKAFFDKLTRVKVHVEGYGAVSMSPQSLDHYVSTPIIAQKAVFTKLW